MKMPDPTVTLKMGVDRDTAETCLKIVQMYCNENGRKIIGRSQMDGAVLYEFDKDRCVKEKHQPSEHRHCESCASNSKFRNCQCLTCARDYGHTEDELGCCMVLGKSCRRDCASYVKEDAHDP